MMSKATRTKLALWLLVGGPILVFSVWALFSNPRLYLVTLLNGLTLASLYFIVASGFTLVFGLMRNVNLAHGSLYLLGGYVGYVVARMASIGVKPRYLTKNSRSRAFWPCGVKAKP